MLALSFTQHTHTSYYYDTVFAGSKLEDFIILYNMVKGTDKSQEAIYILLEEWKPRKEESVRPCWQSPFNRKERSLVKKEKFKTNGSISKDVPRVRREAPTFKSNAS